MTETCVRCGTTVHAALPDQYGIHWCGRCYAKTVLEAELGLQMLGRYLAVMAKRAEMRDQIHPTTLDRIRSYTEEGQ